MGIEDRDWYREGASPEWKRVVYGPDAPASTSGRAGSEWARTRKPFKVLAVVIGVLAATSLAFALRDNLRRAGDLIPSRQATPAASEAAPAIAPAGAATPTANVIHLQPRPGLDTPAATVTQWWVDSPAGRVSVYVPIGETPRQALTVALAQRGYQVVVDP